MTELKGCPFCGSSDVILHSMYPILLWQVRCRKCGVKTSYQTTRELAEIIWNRREQV